MARYRQQLNKGKHEYLIEKYKGLINQGGGLLSSPTRSKLLGQKPEDEVQNYEMESVFPDKSKFWHLLTKNVTSSLADLQLIAEVGSDAELNQMFRETTHQELDKIKYTTDLALLLEKLLRASGETEEIPKEDILWKADLAQKIVNVCFNFFKTHDMISSTAHTRTVDEAKNLIATEIFGLERKGHGTIKDRHGKEYADWVLVPRRIAQKRRIRGELSTMDRQIIEEKSRRKKGSSDLTDAIKGKDPGITEPTQTEPILLSEEFTRLIEPSQPSRDFNDLIEKSKQITEEAVDLELDRRIKEEKGKDVYEYITDIEELNKKKEQNEKKSDKD